MTDPIAIEGMFGQLFLDKDANDSVGQFTKDQALVPASQIAWSNMLDRLDALTMPGVFVVAPAKEEVLPQYFPYPRAKKTTVDDFLRLFADRGVVMPKWPLRARSQFTYSQTDTHWTDYGATIGATETLKALQLPQTAIDALPQNFQVYQRIGDLGVKLDPMRASYELRFTPDILARKVYDNGISNNGNIRVFDNAMAPLAGPCLVLGDSFGTNYSAALSGAFRRVIYAYRPASIDPELMQIVKPNYVILEITQRFLQGQPITQESVFETGAKKIAALPPDNRATLLDNLRSLANGTFHALTLPLLAAYGS